MIRDIHKDNRELWDELEKYYSKLYNDLFDETEAQELIIILKNLNEKSSIFKDDKICECFDEFILENESDHVGEEGVGEELNTMQMN